MQRCLYLLMLYFVLGTSTDFIFEEKLRKTLLRYDWMKSRQIPEKAKHFVVNYGEEAIKTLMTYDPELPKNPILKLFTPKPPGRYEFTRQFAKDVLAALPPEEISNEIRFAAYMCDWKKVKFMLEIGADPKYLRNYKIPDKYLPFLENNTAKRTVNADPPAAYYSAAYSPTAYHLARDIPSTDHFSALTDSQSKVNTAAKLTKMQLSVPPASFYPGLDNVGNTCYLNSVIQTLFHLERFRSVVLTSRPAENSLAKGLQHLFREMQNFRNNEREVASWNPFRFVSLVSRLWTGQQTYAPNDATEFMKWLLSNVHEDTGGQVNVTAFFQGLMRTEINCIGVECQSISYGHFLEIPLPFGNHPFRLGPVISLKEMVKNYFAVEYLTGENQYDSEIFGRRDAKKHNVIVSLPPVLSIHLLRFYVDAWNEISKVSSSVEIPFEIDFKDLEVPMDNNYAGSTKYRLHGFLAHDGGFRGGHYRAVVRNNVNQWILFDDEYVSYVYSLNSYQSTVYQLTFLRVEP